jgi:hypothetical protein
MFFHNKQTKVKIPKLEIDRHSIEFVDEFNFLGFIIDKHLSWKNHIYHISKKISKVTGVICRLKHFLPRHVLVTIYNSLILSQFNYGILLWDIKLMTL